MIRIHPRVRIVNSAGHIIRESIERAISELTYAEVAWLLSDILHSYTADALKVERAEDTPIPRWACKCGLKSAQLHEGPCVACGSGDALTPLTDGGSSQGSPDGETPQAK